MRTRQDSSRHGTECRSGHAALCALCGWLVGWSLDGQIVYGTWVMTSAGGQRTIDGGHVRQGAVGVGPVGATVLFLGVLGGCLGDLMTALNATAKHKVLQASHTELRVPTPT
jgi:hypothetical protein